MWQTDNVANGQRRKQTTNRALRALHRRATPTEDPAGAQGVRTSVLWYDARTTRQKNPKTYRQYRHDGDGVDGDDGDFDGDGDGAGGGFNVDVMGSN